MSPYDLVDIADFKIEPSGTDQGYSLFLIRSSDHAAFESCVFRAHLVNFLFDHMKDEWYLGNDDRFMVVDPDDACLALSARDAARFAAYGWLI